MKIRLATAAASAITVAALAAAVAPAAAQDTGTFTLVQNGQTIATEEFTRTGDRLETRMAMPDQAAVDATATLRPDATVSRLEVRVFPPGAADQEPSQTSAAIFGDGEIRIEMPIGTASGEPVSVEAGTVPYLNPSPSYMEQILRRARAIGGDDEVAVPVWAPGAGPVPPARVTFAGDDATLMLGQVEVRIRTDDQGRLLSASVPAQNLTIERE